jgi:hypothetical protein
MPIVTSTYRYKRPPRKRKPVAIEAPAVVTIDPTTRVAKKGRRLVGNEAAAEEVVLTRAARIGAEAQPSTPPEGPRDPVVTTAEKAPQPANDDDGPRKSAIAMSVDPKKSRR